MKAISQSYLGWKAGDRPHPPTDKREVEKMSSV